MSRRNREYIELLHKDFNELAYIDFVKDLLNLSNSDINENSYEINPTLKQYADDINFYKYFAKYNDGLNNIGAFIVKIKSTNERSKQRNFVASLLSKYDLDSALVAFYSDNESSWRISFVKKELSFTDKGIKQNLTPAKRYSYLVGKNESVHTAQEYLLKLLDIDDRKITTNDIESVFDVEKVTKKFFEEYKEQFLRLQEYLSKNEDFKTESLKYDFDSVEFAKRLMGQIVFLYFLQKKGWLGVQLVPDELSNEEYNDIFNSHDSVFQNLLEKFYSVENDNHKIIINEIRESNEDSIKDFTNIFINTKYNKMWGTGDKQFIRSMYKRAKVEHKNFFDDVLEPFFYDGLNHKRENQYFALLNCKIPFLNGGLFEPLNDYRWASAEFNIPDEYFSNEDETGILDFLDLYNFTIDEEEPLEKEIAVDPEMLGKIFENLLEVNDRKSKGAFYTPREIVYYMCQESLANYLVNKVGTNYDETIEFIKYGDLISQVDAEKSENKDNYEIGQTIYKNLLEIDNALKNVKVADPAVGSGAFPLGMLTEIVKARNAITTYFNKNDNEVLTDRDVYNKFSNSDRSIYELKKETIENCIYAVDIELSAVDIAKLRLWLSLIVDYPNDNEPQPLPNLDCKIMQGNSLIDEYEGVELFSNKMFNNVQKKNISMTQLHLFENVYVQQALQLDINSTDINSYIEEMLKLQKEYFLQSDNLLKKKLKDKIENIQISMVETSLSNQRDKLEKFKEESKKRQKPWFIWKLEFYDVFKNNGGFDIVIGNPPYIDSEGMTKNTPKLRQELSKKYKFAKGNWDIYIVFFELAMNLLNSTGNMIFISPDKWVTKPFGDELRRNLYKNINSIFISGREIFESAKVDSIITNISKKKIDTIKIRSSNFKEERKIDKKILLPPYRLDILFSKHLELLLKINSNCKSLSDKFDVSSEGACATSDAYILKNIIKNDDFQNFQKKFKVVNTGTIVPFGNMYGKREMVYLKDKYLNPIVYQEDFFQTFKNKYSSMVNCKKIIMKGLNLLDGFIDQTGNYLPAKTTLVIKSDNLLNLKLILAFLQSKVISFYINEAYSSNSYNGGITFTKEMIDSIPIPSINEIDKSYIIDLVDKIICNIDNEENIYKLNEYIFKLYNLTPTEISIIVNDNDK